VHGRQEIDLIEALNSAGKHFQNIQVIQFQCKMPLVALKIGMEQGWQYRLLQKSWRKVCKNQEISVHSIGF